MYRVKDGTLEFLLAHPGGPFWKDKDEWSIPKGQPDEGEDDLLKVAEREFEEETSIKPHGPYLPLGTIEQKNNKTVHLWAFEHDAEPEMLKSNLFEMEWPPRSGKKEQFPEMDKFGFFTKEGALKKMRPEQLPFLDRLEAEIKKNENRVLRPSVTTLVP